MFSCLRKSKNTKPLKGTNAVQGFTASTSGVIGEDYACAGTTCPGYCCVPANKAYDMCLADPKCKYVQSTTNAGWNAAYPNSVALRTGNLSPNAQWSSQTKIDEGFMPPVAGMIGQDYPCNGTECPGSCCVLASQAFAMCANDPKCQYVETTTNNGWNAAFPNSKALRTGKRVPNAEWSSQAKVTYQPAVNGLIGQDYACAGTMCPGYCCIPASQAYDKCAADPKCKYVETTTNAGWNAAFPNAKALRTGTRTPNPEWSSEAKNAFYPPVNGVIGEDYACAGTTCPGYCCVPADKAYDMCLADPKCKYVQTTTNTGWNAAYPNSKALRTGNLTPNAQWSSEEKIV